ncbi:MAG TPA: DUF58 domain-containing protein [Ktedonobacteraceae bacterium]|nr:DUF58 domain-containing protein [Ktedonobacteraceae bacterium]
MKKQWYYLCVAIILFGLVIRQPLLLVIGFLGVLVLATTDIWAKYCLQDLRYQRQFSEQRVLFGEEVNLSLAIENAKLLPLPWLEIEDSVPRELTTQGRHMRISTARNTLILENLFSLRWYERVTRPYTVLCNTRGVHMFGPTVLRSGDVFGFLNREESLSNRQYLLVYPLVVPITRFGLPSHHPFGDNRAPRRMLEDPSRVIGVRDYMYGDDLRRVHWKATARMMQLQSKVYQATTTYTLVLFLNIVSQLDAWYGIRPELQELAICATASVADWALDQGYAVGLYTNTIMYMPEMGMSISTSQPSSSLYQLGELSSAVPQNADEKEKDHLREVVLADQLNRRRIHLPPASNEEQRKRIMEVLARVQSYFGSSIEELIQIERTRLPAGATVVVVTSTVSDPLLDALSRVKRSGHAVTILYVGDSPLSMTLGGLAVYHIGGEETWKDLLANNSRIETGSSQAVEAPELEATPTSFSL